jgi:spore germination protein KC
MMTHVKRLAAVLTLVLTLAMTLTGCWDSHELDAMLIITGVALDKADDPNRMDITLQIGETKAKSSGSGEANVQQESTILMKNTSNTLMSGLTQLNQDSSHKLLHHNQVLLLGSALAEQGVEQRIDLFMRDQQSRMEVPVAVVDGRAEELLSIKPKQTTISGIYMALMLDGAAAISPYYRVRMLDFVSRLLDGTTAAVVPLVTVEQVDENQEISISGMAVFKGDRLTGKLDDEETKGYLWAMRHVKNSEVETDSGADKAAFRIIKLQSKRDVSLKKDGGVKVTLSIDAVLELKELSGFEKMTTDQLMPRLIEMSRNEITRTIIDCFEAARRLNADIYGFGTSVHRKYPKEWKNMKDRWDTLFQDIELDIQTEVRVATIGQIGKSLQMQVDEP